MKPEYKYYCRLCWQEFDDPMHHPKDSYCFVNGVRTRLNGTCVGDIRTVRDGTEQIVVDKQVVKSQSLF
jgi:hypothetical protein